MRSDVRLLDRLPAPGQPLEDAAPTAAWTPHTLGCVALPYEDRQTPCYTAITERTIVYTRHQER